MATYNVYYEKNVIRVEGSKSVNKNYAISKTRLR